MTFDAKTFCRQAEAAFIVARESPLVPIFEFVLISPSEKGVTLTASNYGHSIRVVADCQDAPLKAFCVHAPALWPVLKSLDGEVTITKAGKKATVTCGGVSLDVPIHEAGAFPAADKNGGTKSLTVNIEAFMGMVSDLSYFLDADDGLKPGLQNVLIGDKSSYGFHGPAGAASGLFSSKEPFIMPPSVKPIMSRFAGEWDIFAGDGWVRFQQGEQFYRRNCPTHKAEASITLVHNVILNASKTTPVAAFEAARIMPAISRSMLIGATQVALQGTGDKITVTARNETTGAVLEETVLSDGAVFKTNMTPKTLHGILEIIGPGGVVEVSPQTQANKADWLPSLLLKNNDKKFMALLAPITYS